MFSAAFLIAASIAYPADKSVRFNLKYAFHYQDWISAETAKALAEGFDRLGVKMDIWSGAESKGDSLLLFVAVKDQGFNDMFSDLPSSEYRDDLGKKLLDQYGTLIAVAYKAALGDKARAIKKAEPKISAEQLSAKVFADPFIKPSREGKLRIEFRICDPKGPVLKSYSSHDDSESGSDENDGSGSGDDDASSRDPG